MKETQNNLMQGIKRILSWPFIMLIRFYQICISPLKPASCRFTPTCSQYGLQAFKKHGPVKGLILTTWRILRCNPWGGSGYDPVPEHFGLGGKLFGKKDAKGPEHLNPQDCSEEHKP